METSKTEQQGSRIRPGLIIAGVAIFGLLAMGRYLGWFGGSKPAAPEVVAAGEAGTPETATTPSSTATKPENAAGNPPAQPVTRPTLGGKPALPLIASAASQPGQPSPAGGQLKPGEWEQRLDDILGSEEDEGQKATRLLEMYPLLPEDGQVEVAQHLSNLLPDDRYGALAQSLTNITTPDGVLEVLMTDILNRGNNLKLSTLLQVARIENHPKAEEARDVLEVFVDENYGTDWAKWEKAIADWIKENPDEPDEEMAEAPPPGGAPGNVPPPPGGLPLPPVLK